MKENESARVKLESFKVPTCRVLLGKRDLVALLELVHSSAIAARGHVLLVLDDPNGHLH